MGIPKITQSSSHNEKHDVTISNLSEDEKKKIEGVIRGRWWMRGGVKGLQFSPGWNSPPDPVKDPEVEPFWRKNSDRVGWPEINVIDDTNWNGRGFSFSIQHLCGYGYTPEDYRKQAQTLEDFGFVCLRSKRGDEGQFWEIWYLPGLWAAKGRLKAVLPAMAKGNEKKVMIEVVSFLCRNVSFGTLDVTVQRAAMVTD